MTTSLLTTLQKKWQGPAVTFTIAGKSYQLGTGKPATTVVVRDPSVLHRGSLSLAFGEAYMNGDIEVHGQLLDVLEGYYRSHAAMPSSWLTSLLAALPPLSRISVTKAKANAQAHYDLGNDFYQLWLDPALVYSCAYFLRPDDTLAVAQQQKLELLCRKLRLQPGQTLLDIGCGWGGLLFHAAEKYGARVTGITPAEHQAEHIRAQITKRGLQDRVSVIVGDWRELTGQYDRVVSVGMFEHVGPAHYAEFFERWRALLSPTGISLLHTIGHAKPGTTDPWMYKYIFPGGSLPALSQITQEATVHGMVVADVENLWQHYALTLQQWAVNFAGVRERVVEQHGEAFARMWWLYLQGCEAAFRWGELQLWQVVILPNKTSPWPLNREVTTPALA